MVEILVVLRRVVIRMRLLLLACHLCGQLLSGLGLR